MTTYVALVELYRQEKTEVGLLGGKSVHSPLFPPLTVHGLTWGVARTSAARGWRLPAQVIS